MNTLTVKTCNPLLEQQGQDKKTVTAQEMFPIGARVRQRYSASDEIGIVSSHEPGRVLVHWPAWGRTGRYMASFLERVNV